MGDADEIVSVYEGANTTEAHFVRNLLAEEGIQAQVTEENEPLSSLPITPPNVLVHKADEPRARAIIEKYDAGQETRALRPDWTCPKCGATVVGAFDECDVCGAYRPGSEEY